MYSDRLFFSESAKWIKPSYTVAVGWHLLVEQRRHQPLVKLWVITIPDACAGRALESLHKIIRL